MEKFQKKKFKVAFFGSPDISTPLLAALQNDERFDIAFVVTQPDKYGNKNVLTYSPIKQKAKELLLPIHQPATLADSHFVTFFEKSNLDACILFAYGSIIPSKLLAVPHFGWLNVHPSLLPRYRGASPIQSAILDGVEKTGLTLITMDDGIDTGDIVEQWQIPVSANETSLSLSQRIARHAEQDIPEATYQFLVGNKKVSKQPEHGASITKRLKKIDGKIDWSNTSIDIERMVRAFIPWPGTYSFLLKDRITLLAVSHSPAQTNKKPGTLFYKEKNLFVACGHNSVLQIERLQRSGKKAQSGNEFINGIKSLTQETDLKFL